MRHWIITQTAIKWKLFLNSRSNKSPNSIEMNPFLRNFAFDCHRAEMTTTRPETTIQRTLRIKLPIYRRSNAHNPCLFRLANGVLACDAISICTQQQMGVCSACEVYCPAASHVHSARWRILHWAKCIHRIHRIFNIIPICLSYTTLSNALRQQRRLINVQTENDAIESFPMNRKCVKWLF